MPVYPIFVVTVETSKSAFAEFLQVAKPWGRLSKPGL